MKTQGNRDDFVQQVQHEVIAPDMSRFMRQRRDRFLLAELFGEETHWNKQDRVAPSHGRRASDFFRAQQGNRPNREQLSTGLRSPRKNWRNASFVGQPADA